MKKLVALFAIIFITSFMLESCGGDKKADTPEPQTVEEAVTETTEQEVTEVTEEQVAEEQAVEQKEAEVKDYSKTPLKGKVVSITKMVAGGNPDLSPVSASKEVEKGWPVGLLSGGKIFIIYNTDGSFAGKKLAKKAGREVSVYGKFKKVQGMNVIISSKIE